MAASRSKRHNAGKNIGKLLDQELDADDFYKTAYGGFEETLEDGVYQSEESDDDEVDSDFDAPEQEAVSDNEKEEDLEPKRKKKKIITAFKPKPSKPKDAKPKARKQSHRAPNEFPGDVDSRTLRRSTQERSQEFKERFEEETRRRRFTKKKPRTAVKRLTQEELLAEAKRTERENLASLEAYARLEAEKKKVKEKSHEIKGPFIRFHSVVMPLIVDINKEKSRQQLEGEEGTNKSEEKYSRNFLVFTDTKSFPHQYFPQNKPKVAKPQFCQITGLPARYVDPITMTPYATANAFKVIRNQYVSQEEQKCEKRLLQLSNWLEEKKRKKLEVRLQLPMDVFQNHYVQLVQTLPISDAIFISHLYSSKLLPGDLKDQVKAKQTNSEKASHFLDNGIKPGLSQGDRKPFQDLVLVMNKIDNHVIIKLAKEISDDLSSVVVSPERHLKYSDAPDGLAILAKQYSDLYIATRFRSSLNNQPYASNLTKSYIPLTVLQCEARQRQEQLSTKAKEHREHLHILSSQHDPNRHLPLFLKLNHVHTSNGNRRTKNIEDLFMMSNNEGSPQRIILVEGAPGVGKTELVKEIAYCWAEHKLLSNVKLVIVLPLRDPSVLEIKSIKSLVDYFINKDLIDGDMAKCVAKQLRDSQGENVLFLMDGFDECRNRLQEDSFVMHLIDCSVLWKSIVLITSRPSGSYHLHNEINCTYEIYGFEEEAQNLFISLSLTLPDQAKKFTNVLHDNCIVNSYCYIPLYLTLLVLLFKQGKASLPQTLTEIIQSFILHTIYRYLKLNKCSAPQKLLKIEHFPKDVFTFVCQLSEIAFDGIMANKLVFTLEEMEQACPTIQNFADGYGLLQSVEHDSEPGAVGGEISVNFIHYTMQEFLAAYHISRLSDTEQHSLMKTVYDEHFLCSDFNASVPSMLGMGISHSLWHSQYSNMWLMYVGITGGESAAFKKFVHKTESLHDTFNIPKDIRELLLLFQYYAETKIDRIYKSLLSLFDVDNVITIKNYVIDYDYSDDQIVFLPHHMMSLVLLLSRLLSSSQGVYKSLRFINVVLPGDTLRILENSFNKTDCVVDNLYFKSNYLQPSSVKAISGIVITDYLKVLAVVDNYLNDAGIKNLTDALSVNHSIHSLTLCNVWLRSDDVCMLITALANNSIKCLDLSKNFYGSEASKSIAEFVCTCTTLKSLNLSYNMVALSEQGLECLLDTVQSLMQHRFPGWVPPRLLHSALTKNGGIGAALVERYFDFNKTEMLVYSFSRNVTITSLDLSCSMHISLWVNQLARALQFKKLYSLHLYSNNLNQCDASAIASIIKFNNSLLSLNISENIIRDHGMHLVCNELCRNGTLKYLDVSENALTVTSAVAIAITIRCNSTLACLALGTNRIGDQGCKDLANALSVNKTLTSLYIRHNMIGDSGAKALAAALTKNNLIAA